MHEALSDTRASQTQIRPTQQTRRSTTPPPRTTAPAPYTKTWGNQPPPWLRLASPSPAADEQPTHLQTRQDATPQETRPSKPRANTTGLPDALKTGAEQLSGLSLDDVHVHYNSPKPAEVRAFAYTQGTEIHVAPGQEQHLGHETWHVVQQKQGRVQPTLQARGVAINTDVRLEHEASVLGREAAGRHAALASPETLQKEPPKERRENTYTLSPVPHHRVQPILQAMFWEATDTGKYTFHEQDPDVTKYTPAGENYRDAPEHPAYPVYYAKSSMRGQLRDLPISEAKKVTIRRNMKKKQKEAKLKIPVYRRVDLDKETELACWNWALSGFTGKGMIYPQHVFTTVSFLVEAEKELKSKKGKEKEEDIDYEAFFRNSLKEEETVAQGGQIILQELEAFKTLAAKIAQGEQEAQPKKRLKDTKGAKEEVEEEQVSIQDAVEELARFIVTNSGFTIVNSSPFQIGMHYKKGTVSFDHWWIIIDNKIIETFPNLKGTIQIAAQEQSSQGKDVIRIPVQALKKEQLERIEAALSEQGYMVNLEGEPLDEEDSE